LIDEYELGGVGATLEERWTRDEERWSLRELADWFNRQLLAQVMNDAGLQTVDGEVANNYRLLTDDDVREADRVQLRRRLEQSGIDVDTVRREFVTYQAIRSYLKEVRDATRDQRPATTSSRVQAQVNRLAGRVTSVVESQLDQLARTDQLSIGEFRLLVDISVYCEECNTQYDIIELLSDGSCACRLDG
jgi:hypothetical protein